MITPRLHDLQRTHVQPQGKTQHTVVLHPPRPKPAELHCLWDSRNADWPLQLWYAVVFSVVPVQMGLSGVAVRQPCRAVFFWYWCRGPSLSRCFRCVLVLPRTSSIARLQSNGNTDNLPGTPATGESSPTHKSGSLIRSLDPRCPCMTGNSAPLSFSVPCRHVLYETREKMRARV